MLPWSEKHRPERLVDVRGNEHVVQALSSFRTIANVPHLILHGPPGSGKTSSILAMGRAFFGADHLSSNVLELNSSDIRSADTMREQIMYFMKCAPVRNAGTKNGSIKLVILDEACSLTHESQRALGHMLDSSSTRARFCFCCNFLNKLTTGLRSRCLALRFCGIGRAGLARTVQAVADREGMQISSDGVGAIVEVCSGDARQALNLLQGLSLTSGPSNSNWDQAVYDSCSVPSPSKLDSIFDSLLNQSFASGYETLRSCVAEKRFSLVQILGPLVRRFVSRDPLKLGGADRVGKALSALADVEISLSDGGSHEIAMGAIVGAFHVGSPEYVGMID